MDNEKYIATKTFEQNNESIETEKQFIVTDPASFEHYRHSPELQVIEQVYLSHPDEPYSLRLRETASKNGLEHTATLKSRGRMTLDGLERMEIETKISKQAYDFYSESNLLPRLHKLRVELDDGISIDWREGLEFPIIEVEKNHDARIGARFIETHKYRLLDATNQPETSSEHLAHALHPSATEAPKETISAHEIYAKIMRLHQRGVSPIVINIAGRSGSGKTTLTREVESLICETMSVLRISTDDYHNGKKALEESYGAPWTNWDAPEVYNTTALAGDIITLKNGEPITGRCFDFASEEPVLLSSVAPADLIIIEGIYAGSADLSPYSDLSVQLPTPLATSIGRRLERDKKEARLNQSLGNAPSILRYQLETAEPMYRQQSKTVAELPSQSE